MGDLVDLAPPSTNRTCPDCGSEWWLVGPVVIDADTETVNGYAGEPRCAECVRPAPVAALVDGRDS